MFRPNTRLRLMLDDFVDFDVDVHARPGCDTCQIRVIGLAAEVHSISH
jgi:hypothetical protein